MNDKTDLTSIGCFQARPELAELLGLQERLVGTASAPGRVVFCQATAPGLDVYCSLECLELATMQTFQKLLEQEMDIFDLHLTRASIMPLSIYLAL